MRRSGLSMLASVALLSAPLQAGAELWDVIQFKLSEGCNLQKYTAIVNDFNAYYKDKGYQAQLLLPLHAEEQGGVFWVGRSSTTEVFGRAYDHWLAELAKPDSTVSKLSTRFQDCGTLVSRSSYITQ